MAAATDSPSADAGDPPADLLPAVQVRLEAFVRRLDLIERRVAHREAVLSEAREAVAPVASAGDALVAEVDRLQDIEARIARLERRGFGPKGGAALDFARFEPSEGRAGDAVQLSVRVEGFKRGDTLDFVFENLLTGAVSPPLSVQIDEDNPAGAAFVWKIPADTGATATRPGALRFTVRGRGCEARSPVLTVRG